MKAEAVAIDEKRLAALTLHALDAVVKKNAFAETKVTSS